MTSPLSSSPVKFLPPSQSFCAKICNWLRSLFSIFSRCLPSRTEASIAASIDPNRISVISRQSAAYSDPVAEAAINPDDFEAVEDPFDVEPYAKSDSGMDLDGEIARQAETRKLSQKIYTGRSSVKELLPDIDPESLARVEAALAKLRQSQA